MTPEGMSEGEIPELRRKYYNATVVGMIEPREGLRIFRIRPDAGVQDFEAGQYTTLGLGLWEKRVVESRPEVFKPGQERKLLRRAYSMSHPILNMQKTRLYEKDETDFYEFYINLVDSDSTAPASPTLTCRLFKLQKGDRLAWGPKITGHYILEGVKDDDQVFFFATGTGEAPHNAMIWRLLSQGHKGPIVSVVCTRYWSDQGYRKIHEKLQELFSNYRTVFLATREKGSKEKIYCQDLIERGLLREKTGLNVDPLNTHVFLCGSPAMIGLPKEEEGKKIFPKPAGMVEILEKRGLTVHSPHKAGNIHFESYW